MGSIGPSDGEYMFAFLSHVGMSDRIPHDGTYGVLRIPQRQTLEPHGVGIAEGGIGLRLERTAGRQPPFVRRSFDR